MEWSVETLLTVHVSVLSALLVGVAVVLVRRRLFSWHTAGFWSWCTLVLYLVLNPLSSLVGGNLYFYRLYLLLGGGVERGLWILTVTLLGIGTFFVVYLCTSPGKLSLPRASQTVSFPMVLAALPFVFFGLYSLLTQRAYVIEVGRAAVIEAGRFTGEVSGYENSGYLFLVVPILCLLMASTREVRLWGWLTVGLFVWLTLPSGWSRFVPVSMLLAASLAEVVRRRVAWPRWFWASLIVAAALMLQVRGHVRWSLADMGVELLALGRQMVQEGVGVLGRAVTSGEVSALAVWYFESFVIERYYGYSYGLPALNYILTGWVPARFFPQKYFLVDWLTQQRFYAGPLVESLLYGSKSTLLGSFYGDGGLPAVLALSALTGFLARRLDGMLQPEASPLRHALGVAWMSMLWMVWQSSETWGIMTLGTVALPAIAMWAAGGGLRRILSRMFTERHRWKPYRPI